ncbi:MAG TPA: hypothetical protein VKT73_13285 [Xanthobacteraceae bacterium]|nr:hypothetical protein [Xanthobacteraceae bacterium]
MKLTPLLILLALTVPARAELPSNLPVATAKKLILADRNRIFRDPGSIRDAKIGQPFTCRDGSGDCVCIEANAKNALGGYTGIQLIGIQFPGRTHAESFGTMAEAARTEPCGALKPFPELNGKH